MDFHRLLTHFFEEGVVQGVGSELAVVQRAAGANMSVDVGTGLALIEFTTTLLSPNATLKSWLYNDAVINIPVPSADLTNDRIDRIVALFDVSVDPNTAASNIVSIELIEGTPAGSPSAPAEPSNAITLATILVPASDTAITDGQITDLRTNVTVQSGVLADLARQDDLETTQDDAPTWLGTITGTDTLTGSATPARTAYTAGQRFAFKVANTNTGAVTLNVNSLGAKNLYAPDGTALVSGDLLAGGIVECRYDGTQFVMTSPVHSELTIPDPTLTPLLSPIADSSSFGTLGSEVEAPSGYKKTFANGDLVAGDVVFFEFAGRFSQSTTPKNVVMKIKLGSTALVTFATQTGSSGTFWARGKFVVRATSGANNIEHMIDFDSTLPKIMTAVSEAVNTSVTLTPTVTFASDTSGQSAIVDYFHAYKISPP